ncbi:unnamed protein product [Ceutorhynchus assimilis]|uniref:MADF domain-containing protein n=1 Tax=Ceutorhynchus assimilis TaxID=467358 RepID=A0A9N9MEI5_9CUCU|nr:unnamed protein product [Ceutorhynchus assimilis]
MMSKIQDKKWTIKNKASYEDEMAIKLRNLKYSRDDEPSENIPCKKRHHENHPAFQRKYVEYCIAMKDSFTQMGNPFLEHGQELVALDTRVVAAKASAEALYSLEKSGKGIYESFIKERFVEGNTEEADARLVWHARDMAEHGARRVLVRSSVTDVLVLFVSYFGILKEIGLEELWMLTGTRTKRRYVPVHAIAAALGREKSDALRGFYAYTGSDSTSYFASEGNKTCFNTLLSHTEKCGEEFKTAVTFRQVQSKWKSLKRTYKTVLLHNNTSGKQRRYWEFFNKIHGFMHKKPEIPLLQLAAILEDCKLKKQVASSNEAMITKTTNDEDESDTNSGQLSFKNEETSFSKKTRNRESQVAKRHKEKMAKLDRFNDLFEKMVEEM